MTDDRLDRAEVAFDVTNAIEHDCRTSGSVVNNFTSNSAGIVGSAMRGLASSATGWPFQVQAVSRQQPRSIGTPSPIRLLPLACR